jgi:hypothetical protein
MYVCTIAQEFILASAIYDDMIANFRRLHPRHQNQNRGLKILETLREKQVSIRRATETIYNLKIKDTFPFVVEEVRRATPQINSLPRYFVESGRTVQETAIPSCI